jgi:D-alanyl-D-alanine carboxypeptidase
LSYVCIRTKDVRVRLGKPATFKAQLEGKPLDGTNALYGEGIATGSGVCGHSGTINGYGSDMYYFEKLNATLVVNVNRLDRDNKSQSSAVLGMVSKVMNVAPLEAQARLTDMDW